MKNDSKIYVAGHRGLVGSAIVRSLIANGYQNLLFRTSKELDLANQQATNSFFAEHKPDYVILAAAKVGGILANNSFSADFIRVNTLIQTNVIDAAYRNGTKKLLFLGSTCIYPKFAKQPISEDQLLTGSLEPTNAPYAIAKINGITMCESYRRQYGFNAISAMPTNLYGPNDNFDLNNSHVLPALIRKFYDAKINDADSVTCWGDGSPQREFLYVDDLASACLFLMNNYDGAGIINVGVGKDISIRELVQIIASQVGYKGEIIWDTTKPNGTPRKLIDVTHIHELGWNHKIPLRQGIRETLNWYIKNRSHIE